MVAAVLRFLFGSIEEALWPVAGAMGLGIAALAVPLTDLQQLFGAKGFTLDAMTMMFLGNPLAGIATTGDWLPSGLGELGQALPPGAAGSLVRSTAYFDGAGGLTAAPPSAPGSWSGRSCTPSGPGARHGPQRSQTDVAGPSRHAGEGDAGKNCDAEEPKRPDTR
ncbi:hypothetical protein [Nocardioides daphniae]|uniref:Uncharacterized protein n=1 Tax=Nocardioides daphniae TaxID=402297 RepID=A0A4P7UBK0_9ACTN|nr:hypothetical protein [Nocardioides daphniae]QCC77523.1 hypothetical protein E2C04_10670 [Nocardioides daphniae]GGD31142.1 hypothetical protein GCM10007231_33370 [Nocardioides daphniae]